MGRLGEDKRRRGFGSSTTITIKIADIIIL
jgi:hypothetical protein